MMGAAGRAEDKVALVSVLGSVCRLEPGRPFFGAVLFSMVTASFMWLLNLKYLQ